jgi:16S rRNA (guanine1207-N2)-methyltransferase/23S rRNA (guanine1835-N2)-methyltransferase
MISPFNYQDTPLNLDRFPLMQVNRSLQAWDAADEYLLNYCAEQKLVTETTNILIFNDAFGALTTSFCVKNTSQEAFLPTVSCINDSFVSRQGIAHNIEQNHLSNANITQLDSLDNLPKNADVILYKIPKSNALLIEQLIRIKSQCKKDVIFIAADRAKDIHSSTLKLFEKHLGTTKTSLAVKKARLVFCEVSPCAESLEENQGFYQLGLSPFPTRWSLEDKATDSSFTISNHANVYSREKLDIGARYFIENLPSIKPGTKVIDLGCGNGVIGLTLLASQPEAEVAFYDESSMAIASAKLNIENNLPQISSQCEFNLDDCLTSVPSNSVDLIVCNPPFHQHNATTDHIAWQMFKDSHRVLKKGGELRIIGNRQLAYHIKLQRIFGNETRIASNEKFVTQSAIKR